MGVFEGLSERIGHIFSKITSRGKLTELEIKQAMREVRIALLEADVNITVVKDFIRKVSQRAVGEEILKSLNAGQQVIKIVNEELIDLMGSKVSKLAVSPKPPTVIMMCGLQGAGKTTMCGKLGAYLTSQGKKPLLVACDIYRPAAIKQLQVVGQKAKVPVFEMGAKSPIKIASEGVKHAIKMGLDTVILDTAGRLHINEELMKELQQIKANQNPAEILLVVDSMTGQDAVTVASEFDRLLDITGVIMTKLDGDTRGGAALSIKAVTGKPIKFCGTGEKLGDIEPFYPDRMASRILGMGDVLTLIEKAQQAVTEEDLAKLEKKMKANSFTLEDYLQQFEQMKKMGGIQSILSMMPGMGKFKQMAGQVDEKQLAHTKSIILSMTPEERRNPDIIKASRRKRIADGSGNTIQAVNQLLNQFEASKKLMKQMSNGKMPFKNLPF